MAIKYDRSDSGILVICTECAYWYAFRFTQLDAYLSGESHQIRVHDVPAEVADNARMLWGKRHAAPRSS